jgi:hypothetical protein
MPANAWVSVLLLAGLSSAASLSEMAINEGWLMAPTDWQALAAAVLGGFVSMM